MLKGSYTVNDNLLYYIYTCLICAGCEIVCREAGESLEVSKLIRRSRTILSDALLRGEVEGTESSVLSYLLSSIVNNIRRVGDPLGLDKPYWLNWALSINVPKKGSTIILTSRMYQMAPYLPQITKLVDQARGMVSSKLLRKIITKASGLGLKISELRLKREIVNRSERILQGIYLSLTKLGLNPSFLYEDEPYSGALLYDLGLDDPLVEHSKKVYRLLKERDVKTVITVDPHTFFMLKQVYPSIIDGFDIEVRHYIEVLSSNIDVISKWNKLGGRYVIHDPCTMARDLGVIEEPRKVIEGLGIDLVEPEDKGIETKCCGGPIEYAYPKLSKKIALERLKRLSKFHSKIVSYCPICWINLGSYEEELNLEVRDLGELLYEVFFKTK